LTITDPKTKKVVGYLNDGQTINITVLNKGFKHIDTAIEKYPSRLDMRFGEIYMLGKIPDYNKFTTKLVAAIDYSDKIKTKLLWANGKPVEDPVRFMLDAEQTYITQLYDAGGAELGNMRLVAGTVLKYYTNSVENLSNLAITYMVRKKYEEALEKLLKANKIAPTDYIVINNTGYCYKGLNDKPNAIKYYQLAQKYGNDDSKAYAKKQLEELKK
jgi:tetratricopeptide (TPR) repeat protein